MVRSTNQVRTYIGAVTQPNLYDCQSTAIYAVTGGVKSIGDIRASLEDNGTPGDPANMGREIRSLIDPALYEYYPAASLDDMRSFLDAGCVLVVHGYFSESGHVIVIDGRAGKDFDVMDVFEEFDATDWIYPRYWSDSRKAFDGIYSDLLIYATCVAGGGFEDACNVYRDGVVESTIGGAWLHVIKPTIAR
jgi:hypothetical protein